MVPRFFSNTSKKQNTCPIEVKRNTRMGDGKGLRIMVPGFFSNTFKKQNTCPIEEEHKNGGWERLAVSGLKDLSK